MARFSRASSLVLVLSLPFVACGGDDVVVVDIEEREGCNPLVPAACGYPYPNTMQLAEDASSATGYRVAFTESTLGFEGEYPRNKDALAAYLNRADGFSIGTPILAHLGSGDIDRTTIPSFEEAETTLDPSSPIQVFDRETGERIPLWAETDLRAETGADRSVMIRLQQGLDYAKRYAVVFTNAVKEEGGADITPSPAYAALRDGQPTSSDTVEGMRADYDALFEFLEAQGVSRDDTILAWEFVTFSEDFHVSLVAPHVEIAHAALADPSMIPAGGMPALSYEMTCASSDMDDAAATGCTFDDTLRPEELRRITGTYYVPSFLDPETGEIGLGADGSPQLTGTIGAEFVAIVPTSLADAPAGSAPVVVFGHGVLGSPAKYMHETPDKHGVPGLAEQLGAIVIGTRWVGISEGDESRIVTMLSDGAELQGFIEGLVQSVVSFSALPAFVRGDFQDDPALAANGGGSLVDESRAYYYGISLGAIFGSAVMATSPDLKTGVLHTFSAAFSNWLQHTIYFNEFQNILQFRHQRRLEQQQYLALFQRLFDPVDPVNWVSHFEGEGTLTPLGDKNVLMQIACGDAGTPDFNAYTLARTGDVPILEASAHAPFGLTPVSAPVEGGTTMVLWDAGIERPELRNDGMSPDTQAHESIRRNPEVYDQIENFFGVATEGQVIDTCGGDCTVVPVPYEGDSTYPPPAM